MLSPADLYDYVYSWKPYQQEAESLAKYIRTQFVKRENLIEFACGTGRYLEYLSKWWSCTGVDLCSDSLSIAKRRSPTVKFVQADMIDVDLKDNYDVAICLFGGISYISFEDLTAMFQHWHQQLLPGGLLIIEPWREAANVHFDQPFLQSYQSSNFRLSRAVTPKREGGTCILDFYFLLAIAGHKVQRFQQREVLHLHSWDSLLPLIQDQGFSYKDSIPGFLEAGSIWIFEKR